MKTRDRPNFSKKQVKSKTFSVALFVAAILIFSAIPTIATPGNTTKLNKINMDTGIEEIQSTGLPPRSGYVPTAGPDLLSSGMVTVPAGRGREGYIMYMEHAVSGGGAERFSVDTDDPGTIVDDLGDSEAGDFLSGGTFGCDMLWYGVEYATGVLWAQDIYTGDMWSVGGGAGNLNSLSWDPITNRMYGTGSVGTTDTLYEIDPLTGEQIEVFTLSYSGGLMIGIAFDADGVLYGWELVSDKLWIIDIEAEEVTEVGSLGININYAQDGDFHRESDTLYLTAYVSGGALYECDEDTGDCTYIGNLPSSWECTASCFENTCIPPEHDVGVKAILKPSESGHAVPSMDMELLVKNYGQNPETFDAQMEIIKCEDSGVYILDEDFSGGVMPENWTTDFWTIVNSNNAGGDPPEARVYRYDQYYGGQYYDNYIQSAPVDATGWEKLTMTFNFAANMLYPQYCAFYVKWRKNETSAWKDVTPWDNPLGANIDGEFFEIDCYGFGEELGEDFEIQFKYQGYYYYFNYFYLDDIWVQGCGGCAEYAELEEDISLQPGQEQTIVFPGWQPSEWHNESYQDAWESYPVHGFIVMEGDQWPRNDNKWILLELYYPWFYDIEVTEIGEPQEARSIPARTFDVEATITNVGQFPACCIQTDISIGAPYVVGTAFTEYTWPTTGFPYYYIYGPGYGSGWRDDHKNLGYYYGWRWRNGNQAGGTAPEAYLYYYYARADYYFKSIAIDTTEYQSLQLNFLSYINHFSGSGLYALEAGYSHDGENWFAAWHEEPGSSGSHEVSVPIQGGSDTTYIGLWVKGNPYYFNYWYVDNIELKAMGVDVEYTDMMCQGDDLEPGQSRTFYFDAWTPDFLQYETTAWEVPYVAECTIDVEVDDDPGNNICVNNFELDYWHDAAIDRVTSPAPRRDMGELLWDNGDTDGSNGYSILASPERTLLDDFEVEGTWQVDGLKCYCVAGPVNTPKVGFWSDIDNEPDELVEQANIVDFNRENTGRTWFGYQEWEYQAEFDPVVLEEGRHWVEIGQTSGSNTFIMIKADYVLEEGWLKYTDYGYFMPFSQFWGSKSDLNFRLFGEAGGAPGISTYIKPSTQSITAVAKNLGTFQELDLVCNAQIWEYITDPENGTMQYEDDEVDIDLDTPLGGEVPLTFEDFTFAYEGRYGLFLNMPDENDDFPKNNKKSWGIGVDNTKPVSSHVQDPTGPDGDNGWYVSDIEVTLSAYDPLVMDVSSGVKELKYKVGTGGWQTITGSGGSFLITQADDGEDVPVEYYAVDKVGNEEAHHYFDVDMDQTPPTIDLTYEVLEGNPIEGWTMLFTATCSDATSGLNRVEFFLNEKLQSTVTGGGPTYQWQFVYHQDFSVDIKADVYDNAGNMAFDIVEDPKPTEYNNFNIQQQSMKILQK